MSAELLARSFKSQLFSSPKALALPTSTAQQVYSECPSFDELIPALLAHPIEELPQRVHFKPGVPIKPMLAKPTTGVHRPGP